MRFWGAIVTVCCLAAVAGAWAGEPAARRTPSDYVKALQAAPPAGPCEHGLPLDADGVCPTVKDSTRGFNLLGSSTPSKGAGQSSLRRRSANRRTANRTGVLDDLRITFSLGSAEISPQGKAEAAVFAKALETPALAAKRVEIGGYTDARGAAERNLALSQARADAVKDFLVAQGVDASRLVARGFGSEDLAIPTQPYSAANRRVAARRLD